MTARRGVVGCHGIILVFDVNERETFQHLSHWMEEIDLYSNTDRAAKLLVGNKIDLKAREVSPEEAQAFARRHATMYIETSAKTREGIRQSFEEVVQKILDTPQLLSEAAGGSGFARIAPSADDQSYASYCGGYC